MANELFPRSRTPRLEKRGGRDKVCDPVLNMLMTSGIESGAGLDIEAVAPRCPPVTPRTCCQVVR